MRKTRSALYVLAAIITAGVLSIMILFFSSDYSILGINDFKDAIKSYESPAITIPQTGKAYYDKWKCFNTKNIEILKGEVSFSPDTWRSVPLINAHSNKRSFYFEVPHEREWDSDSVTKYWKHLIGEERSICFFAAYLQTDTDGAFIYFINKIKTKTGYWDAD